MKKYINLHYIIIAAVLVIIPMRASAATMYVETSRETIQVGDTAVISVKINSDGAVLNTVDGEVAFKSPAANLSVQEFSLANSSFGLWPRTPSVLKDGHTITYVGGVPGGFSIEHATLFKIIVEAKKEGVITIHPQNTSVFANDGKGTKLPVQLKDIVLNVISKKSGVAVQNDWAGIVSQDVTPPENFIVVAGQEDNLFGGKKFVYFSAVDNQSGIDHYDVSENGGPVVRSGSTYVLQDQSDSVMLNVVAYDKAGNKKVATYTGISGKGISWPSIAIVVAVLVIAYIGFIMWKRNRKNASNLVK